MNIKKTVFNGRIIQPVTDERNGPAGERKWFWFLGSGNQGDPVWIAQVDAFDFRMFFDQAGEQFFQPF